MFGLCKYKNLFGPVPHTPRIFNLPFVDWITTFIGVGLFSYFTKYSFVKSLVFALLLMLFVHRIFCIKARSDVLFFPNENDWRFYTYVVFFFLCVCPIFFYDFYYSLKRKTLSTNFPKFQKKL